jgi:hypothetical protein
MKLTFYSFVLILLVCSFGTPLHHIDDIRALNSPQPQVFVETGANGPNDTQKQWIADVQKMEGVVIKNISSWNKNNIIEVQNGTAILNKTMNNCITLINETIDTTFNTWNKTLQWRNESIFKEIYNMTDSLTQRLKLLGNATIDSLSETVQLAYVIIGAQVEKKTDELGAIEDQMTYLKSLLPPVTSNCGLYFDCDSCTTNPSCGWCSSSAQCIDGDAKGPLTVICPYYSHGKCNDAGCSNSKNCFDCVQNPYCGWCTDETMGYQVCIQETASYDGCPAQGWYHLGNYAQSCDVPRIDPFTLKRHVVQDNVGKINPNNDTTLSPTKKTWIWQSIQNKLLVEVNEANLVTDKINVLKLKLWEIQQLYDRVVNDTLKIEYHSPAFLTLPNKTNSSNSSNSSSSAKSLVQSRVKVAGKPARKAPEVKTPRVENEVHLQKNIDAQLEVLLKHMQIQAEKAHKQVNELNQDSPPATQLRPNALSAKRNQDNL